jgi:hypothetical protein
MRELVSLPLFRGRVRDIGVKLRSSILVTLPLQGGGLGRGWSIKDFYLKNYAF